MKAVPLAVAFFFGLILFLFKMQVFFGLGYSLDLFMQTQVATSWMDGRPFHDNYYGNHLGTHTYLLLPSLGFFARAFGSPGLLLVLAFSAGAALYLAENILRERGLSPRASLCFATLLVASPFSIHTFHDWQHGFHVELLEPALALALLRELLRERSVPALGWAMVLIYVKEDAPLLAASIAVIALIETGWMRHRTGLRGTGLVSRSAMGVIVLSLAALPMLLYIIKLNTPGAAQGGAMTRLPLAYEAGVRDYVGLAGFIGSHIIDFLFSPQVRLLLLSAVCASFGALLLRPHIILLLIPFALVSWLQSDDPLWASRFAPTLAISWCAALLGIGTVWSAARSRLGVAQDDGAGQDGTREDGAREDGSLQDGTRQALSIHGSRRAGWTIAIAGILSIAICTAVALGPAGAAIEFYTFAPWTYYTSEERRHADELFEEYRAKSTRDEPVIAHIYLYRYAHDRNLFWFYSVPKGFTPKWILWDERAPSFAQWGYVPAEFECLGKKGRFGLYRCRN